MLNSVMLYRHPGPHHIHNNWFDYIIVHENEVEIKIQEGWYLTTSEALLNSNEKVEEVEFQEVPEDKVKKVDFTQK